LTAPRATDCGHAVAITAIASAVLDFVVFVVCARTPAQICMMIIPLIAVGMSTIMFWRRARTMKDMCNYLMHIPSSFLTLFP
jgi:hypothetical protein